VNPHTRTSAPAEADARVASAPVSVIDIGTTSIRMTIGQVDGGGELRALENLSRPVPLGRDTFTRGVIEKETIRDVVRVLRDYRELLREYGLEGTDRVRVVATSAVQEAANRGPFLDRIEIATGFRVELIDEAEVSRLTYLPTLHLLRGEPELAEGRLLVVKIGGGSTETLFLSGGDVVRAQEFRQGTLRLRKTLEAYDAPVAEVRAAMTGHIRRIVERVVRDVPEHEGVRLLALGADVRLAATEILPEWKQDGIREISLEEIERLAEVVLPLSLEELARRHRRSFPEVQTLVPALLTWIELGRAFNVPSIHAAGITLRDGVLQEMTADDRWTDELGRQIVRSALHVGRRFGFNEGHGVHVAYLASAIFRALQSEHRLRPRHELLLKVAAVLHDVGNCISNRAHHKHSLYIILNGDLFGIGRDELVLAALVARYHRRASPKSVHEHYSALGRSDRLVVAKLAAILRVADALDRSDTQRVRTIECSRDGERFVISVADVEDLLLEQIALYQKGSLFEETYGMQVHLRPM
jgi:exopolyphosphatase/guanosine-5'-triphosphate,3'-diphosphate pyrophosphatase